MRTAWHKQPKNYTPKEAPDYPWNRWDMPLTIALRHAKWWRGACVGCLGLAVFSTWQMSRAWRERTIQPYVIEVSEAGQVRAIGPVRREPYEPSVAAVQRELGLFVESVRGISADSVVLRRNWERAWPLLTEKAGQRMRHYLQENDPRKLQGKVLILVEVQSVLRLSERSYQVEWKETVMDAQVSAPKQETTYAGIFHLIVAPPADEKALRENPLGIYIDSFTWTRKAV